ncbi:MAG: biotin/lipoyl-containing protein [Verrucomicrobiota bacterium]|jgi:biotin carboxyl carrier protein
MIKRLRVTVDGSTYDVTVEVPEETTPTDAPTPAISAPPLPPSAAAAGLAASPPAPAAQKAAPTPPAPSEPGDVPCPLSGRVTAVLVQPGQEVKEGDHLVTLEAMKMNTFVFAPRSGKVTAVRTEVGAVVEENQVLVTIG